jgi:hypothetical protein
MFEAMPESCCSAKWLLCLLVSMLAACALVADCLEQLVQVLLSQRGKAVVVLINLNAVSPAVTACQRTQSTLCATLALQTAAAVLRAEVAQSFHCAMLPGAHIIRNSCISCSAAES